PHFVEAPLSMSQHPTWTDDEVIDSSGDRVDLRSANENAKGIVRLRDAPWARTGLGHMDFALPATQDDVGVIPARSGKAQALPKFKCGCQIVARNDCESADCRGDWHMSSPCTMRNAASCFPHLTRARVLTDTQSVGAVRRCAAQAGPEHHL